MTTTSAGRQFDIRWRRLMWAGLALALVAPAAVMRFTEEVHWTGGDFAAAALLLGAAGVAIELVTRYAPRGPLRMALLAAVMLGAMLVWAEGAVGILD